MNKVYVGVDEPMEYNLGQSQYMDGFKKYSKWKISNLNIYPKIIKRIL